mmetsp:Transcript_2727/g.6349  ORF Transcript_2727/g.6349 Transcript_2727/m.6349 type:complete len:293 (-) Transcript_2727:47-925(-)
MQAAKRLSVPEHKERGSRQIFRPLRVPRGALCERKRPQQELPGVDGRLSPSAGTRRRPGRNRNQPDADHGRRRSLHDAGPGGSHRLQQDPQGRLCVVCHHRANDGESLSVQLPIPDRTGRTETSTVQEMPAPELLGRQAQTVHRRKRSFRLYGVARRERGNGRSNGRPEAGCQSPHRCRGTTRGHSVPRRRLLFRRRTRNGLKQRSGTERNGWGRHPSGHGVLRLISNRNHNHRDHNHNAGHAECKPRREKQSNAMQCNASLQRNPAERNQWFEIFDSFFGFETTTPNKVYT